MLHNLRLSRIPQDDQLQAWNAADELLIKRIEEVCGKTLIVNDHFGALAAVMHKEDICWWNDSATSIEAMELNSNQNNIKPLENIRPPFDSRLRFETVVIQIPKSASYFAWQLEALKPTLTDGGTVLALGMVKHISQAHIQAMNSRFELVNPGRAEKKARVISLKEPVNKEIKIKEKTYKNPTNDKTIKTLPGCFSEKTVDPGARVFISHFHLLPKANKVLDLGCGNGILSQSFQSMHPEVELHLSDDNWRAIESAKLNLEPTENCFFHHSNGLNSLSDSDFDLILCNPPFHQNATVTEAIAEKLIEDAANNVTTNGELWLVANRHLDYRKTLKRHFNTIKIVSKDARFNVIRCASQ